MLNKVLIANRAEIALRVIRACRDLGVASVAVYSEADVGAAHVRLADEAIAIGPSPATQSYLAIDAIIDAAKRSGADAVHPGYGFLSENPALAAAVADAGLTFVGPPAEVIATLGSKLETRRTMIAAGVPVLPGSEVFTDMDFARGQAAALGYPLLVKPSEGGGGRGMHVVHSEDELQAALETSRRETLQAFGTSDVYMEKLLHPARHIEVQIIADTHGNVVHVGDRDCSLQRRHQKLVEEAPAPGLSHTQHKRVQELAVRAARAAGYVNAGTVEFLFDGAETFYLLEVNTRIQVEHSVTEVTTGIDLVAEQLRIASGAPLSFAQKDVSLRGTAIETRVYAEDPERGFIPSPGRITALRAPAGPWVREDRGYEAGDQVSPFYDGMISKLIVWGPDRQTAIARTRRALREYLFEGIATNVSFLQRLIATEAFRTLDYDTRFVERVLQAPVDAHAVSAVHDPLSVRIEELMTPCTHSVRTTATLDEVELEMASRGISAMLVVTEESVPIGLITRTDLLRSGLLHDPHDRTLRLSQRLAAVDIYHDELLSLSRFATLRDAVEQLAERRVHRLLVTHDGDPVGVLSLTDLLHVVASGPRRTPIGQLSTRHIDSVAVDSTVAHATAALVRAGVHGLVVTRDGEVVGSFSQREALAAAVAAGEGARVEDWMHRAVLALPADTPMTRAARELLATGAPLVVVLEGGRRNGVVTASDLVAALR